MAVQTPNKVIIYIATVGASPGATFSFFSRGYQPPAQGRSIEYDVVHNQNGVFKYIYDNGPNLKKWAPFELLYDDNFAKQLSGAMASQQLANIYSIWRHIGNKTMKGPDGITHKIHWSTSDLERSFVHKPFSVGDKLEGTVLVQFEEATT